VEAQPDRIADLERLPAVELEALANDAFRRGELATADRAFRVLGSDQPERLDVAARLGYLDLLSGDTDNAVVRLSTVLERGMRRRSIISHLGEAYYRRGDLGHAALCFQQLGRDGFAGTLAAMADRDILRLDDAEARTSLAWLVDEPLPVIRARVNGVPANLVLDTGAGDCLFDLRFAVSADVRLGGVERRHFAGGQSAQVTHAHLELLQLGDVGINDLPVQLLDLQATFDAWFPALPIHGIVGCRVLSLFECVLDYDARRLVLTPPRSTSQAPAGTPLWLAENWLLLTDAVFPGQSPALVFLDSGMTGGAFAVPASRADALGVLVDSEAVLVGTGGAGRVPGSRASADVVGIDRLRRHDVDGLQLPSLAIESALGFRINGLIGHDMLRATRLSLDFANQRLKIDLESG
jgi:hypothetical protein